MKSINLCVFLVYLIVLTACNEMDISKIEIQGHRGCRGILPENSIPAFIKALELGVHTLELDVVISKDHQVVVSHEPWMSPDICIMIKDSEGNQLDTNMYHLTYTEILKFDCGSIPHARFPDQERLGVTKPLLKEVFRVSEIYTTQNNLNPVNYNIEIKRRPEFDRQFHPEMTVFADLVINEVNKSGFADRITIQCFDIETLQYIHQQYPDIRLVYLIEREIDFKGNIEKLGFNPEVYSPYFKLVNKELINYGNKHNMRIIPWTVNSLEEIKFVVDLGVHGIITDYPDRLINYVNSVK